MPSMIGSTMRAAPSTMSSGGWKRCSAVLRSAIVQRVLVGDPAGVDAVHVDAVAVVVGRGRARHHVQRRLGHVRVRMAGGLEAPVELPLDRRDVDDVLVALGRAQHQRLQPRVEHERRDGVDELRLEQLDRSTPRRAGAATSSGRAGRPAAGPGRAGPRGTGRPCRRGSSGRSAHLRQLGRAACRTSTASRRVEQAASLEHVVAAQPGRTAPSSRCTSGASVSSAARSSSSMWR